MKLINAKHIFTLIAVYSIVAATTLLTRQPSGLIDPITESITFFTSFDQGFDADYAEGDVNLYMAASWSDRNNRSTFNGQSDHLTIAENEGRYRHALRIENGYTPVYFYHGHHNMPYQDDHWSGSVSFWLKLDPNEDLAEGYSDPVQITTRNWNDGALYVDFTNEDPRRFRCAFFPDREVWDPQKRDWEDVPADEWPMVVASGLPFSRDEWTFIAFSFRNFNTGKQDAVVDCYINGEYIGSLTNIEQTITWNPEEIAIWLGYNYRGLFDELTIFNRNLSDEEIRYIYNLDTGISSILPR